MARAGMNQAKLVAKTGRSKGYVSEILSGKKEKPSIDICGEFAEVLGCSPLWLFDGTEDVRPETQNLPPSMLRDDVTPYRYTPKAPPGGIDYGIMPVLERIAAAQEAIALSETANVESQRRIANALEKLVEIEQSRKP